MIAVSVDSRTRWGHQAVETYTDAYAARYRAHDDVVLPRETVARLGGWLRHVCDRFAVGENLANLPNPENPANLANPANPANLANPANPATLTVLDLGCGTGRYFHALRGVRRLVGVDVSRPMLDRARHPAGELAIAPEAVTLVEGDLLTHDFAAGEFDLVYSIGVLAEHAPFGETIAARVGRWLKPGGRFAFTTVHPSSPSVPRTFKRRLGERLLPVAPSTLHRALRDRLMSAGMYADEERVSDVLGAVGLTIESLERFESDVHLHVLAVAVRA